MIELPLTEEQRRVVEAPIDGPHLVNAGAGTGKTYTLVARTVHLVRAGVDPRALLLITFTNAAAAEITTRIDAAFGVLEPRRPTCGTFHSVAAGLLREFAYETGTSPDIRVIDDGRARALFRRVFEEMRQGTLGLDLSAFPLLDRPDILERDLAGLALRFKQIGLTPDAFEQQALAHAADLERITFGGVKQLRNDGAPRSGWPKPNPERTEEERRDEADRERRNARVVAGVLRRFDELLEAAHRRGPITSPLHRDRLAGLYAAIACIRYSTTRELANIDRGGQPSATMGGLAKLSWARTAQEMAELAVSILGPAALSGPWSKNLLMSPAMSIAGGTNDINRNIVGEHGLGLPR